MRPLFLLLLCAFYLSARLRPEEMLLDGDTGWRIRVGQSILDGGLPERGLFSWTAGGRPWVDHSWLSDAILGALERHGGLSAVVAFCSLLFAWPFARVVSFLLSAGRPVTFSLAAGILGWLASSGSALARPHLFTFAFLVEWGIALSRRPWGTRLYLYLLGSGVLWANLHGGFLAGLLLLGLRLPSLLPRGAAAGGASARRGPVLLALSLAVLIPLLTPYGPRLIGALATILGEWPASGRVIEEWAPTSWLSSPAFLLLAALAGLAAFRWRAVLGRGSRLELAVWLLVALAARRFVATAVSAALPILGRGALPDAAGAGPRLLARLERILGASAAPWPGRRAAWLAAPCLAGILALFHPGLSLAAGLRDGMDPRLFPVGTAAALREEARGRRIFHTYEWGGFLIYAWRGDPGVFIDGRYEQLYRDDVFPAYEEIMGGGEGALDLLDRRGIDLALVPPDTPLAVQLASSAAWRLAAQDPCSRGYVRR